MKECGNEIIHTSKNTGGSSEEIDIVLTWVDGNDPEWIREKKQFVPTKDYHDGAQNVRYRDWNNVQYIFRGIEKFMPWVRKVHFVTWGHVPSWLNTNNPKLHIVNHRDFIPEEYLPTFNSNTIELNLHRIPGISEQFINFNDDMFIIGQTRPEDFFLGGLPCDMAILSPAPCSRDLMCCVEANNFGIINDYFTVQDVKKNWMKWYTPKYGKYVIRTCIFSNFHSILGIFEPHIPLSHLRSTMQVVWEKEFETLSATCKNKVRTRNDVNVWLFRHWQIMSGNFVPRKWNFGLMLAAGKKDDQICSILAEPGKMKLLCINDTKAVENFEISRDRINLSLNNLLPQKSEFEK